MIDFSHGISIYEKCPKAVEPLWVEVKLIIFRAHLTKIPFFLKIFSREQAIMTLNYIINIWIDLRNFCRWNWLTDNQRIPKDKIKVLNTLRMEMLEVRHFIENV